MASLLHPGVYVRELSSGVRVIEGAATSTTIFVGETERGPFEATRIKGIADYERLFGGYLRVTSTANMVRVTMRYAIDAFFANGGTSAYIARAIGSASLPAARVWPTVGPTTHRITAASPGVWAAGHLSAVLAPPTNGAAGQARIMVFYRDLRRPTQNRVLVEDFDRLSLDVNADNYVGSVLERSVFIRWDTSLTPAAWPATDTMVLRPSDVDHTVSVNPAALLGGGGGAASATSGDMRDTLARLDGIEDASLIVYAADAWAQNQGSTAVTTQHTEVFSYVINRPKLDLFYLSDLLGQHNATSVTAASNATTASIGPLSKSDFMAWYWPHLKVSDPVGQGLNPTIFVPPSGAVAGIFARTDRLRGVWKAPAGVEAAVGSIVGIEHDLLDTHQDDLNPLGINALRTLPASGPVVWGARTTMPSSEWRYVPVRRTAIFLRKSIYNGIQWAVFEPNNADLWRALRVTVGAFMETQFRNGAFAGSSPKDAYFVKCDAETTPENAQLQGIVNIVVGFAPLRPAEFVVLSLTQMTKLAS